MHKLEKAIYAIAATAVIVITAFSFTYAYILPKIIDSETSKSIDISSAKNLSLEFLDGEDTIAPTDIAPGWSQTKYFSVVNNTNGPITYQLGFVDVTNTLVNKGDLVFTLTSTNGGASILPEEGETGVQVPDDDDDIKVTGVAIAGKTTQEYTLTVTYINADHDQSDDIGKNFNFTISVN